MMKKDYRMSRPARSVMRPFAEYVLDTVYDAHLSKLIRDPRAPDVLAALDYKSELAVKREALRRFWKQNGLPEGMIRNVIPSIRPRNYRTTSKRRVVFHRGSYYLDMGYGRNSGGGNGTVLEAELHDALFRRIQQFLNLPGFKEIGEYINYCILRGTYEEAALIWNVNKASGDIVRKLRMVSENLARENSGLRSAFMLVDESRSDYYLEAAARTGKDRMFKKFFGPEIMVQPLDGKKLFYPPDVFSQVNGSMCELFAEKALTLLNPPEKARVLDLYCGYGLLTMKAAQKVNHIIGIDWEGPAIRAAKSNAGHLYPEKNIRFAACAITQDTLEENLPPPGRPEYVILDPPRSGAAAGVTEALAARKPEKILHIFCGTDQIPHAVKHWENNGFHTQEVCVLDMFPGSANLETMVLLERD